MDSEKELKIIYKQLKGLLDNLPDAVTPGSVVSNYHSIIDEMSELSKKDFSQLKLGNLDSWNNGDYRSKPLQAKLGIATGTLEALLGVDDSKDAAKNTVTVINKAENLLALEIKQSITQLITVEENEDTKNKLKELDEALAKKDKSKLGSIIKKIIDGGMIDLLLKMLPEILKRMQF